MPATTTPETVSAEEILEGSATVEDVTPDLATPVDPPVEPVLADPTPAEEPIAFTRTAPEPPPPSTSTAVEPQVLISLLNFRRACRDTGVGITSVQFQIRPDTDEDEISHHGFVVYDTRYLNERDQPVYMSMQNPSLWNLLAVGRIRLYRNATEQGPVPGMYYWGLENDSVVRLGDAAPETEGTVIDPPAGVAYDTDYVVGG